MKYKFLILILFTISSISINAQFTQTVVSVTGVTISDVDNTPVKGQIKVFEKESGKMVNRARTTGKYFVTGLKPGKAYEFAVSGKGYFYQTFDVEIPLTKKYSEFSRDFALKPMELGAKIPMKVIPFDIKKTQLRPGSDFFLDDYVNIMKSNMRASFEILVFPEDDADQTQAMQFSQERANALMEYLQSKKVRCEITVNPQNMCDPNNPKPTKKRAKGKRYKGSVYLVVKELG